MNQTSPYLPLQRHFPADNTKSLGIELDKTYVDIANKVNARTIGLFALNTQIVTGEQWYISGQPQNQQTLRQLFTFTSTATIAHNINFAATDRFTLCYGEYTNGTNWFGLIHGSNVAIAGQISFYITPTNIVFLVGAGAPALTKGNIVLQWLSNF